MEEIMKSAPGRPSWVERVQKQGLSPAVLESYLHSGWPLAAIAAERNLDIEDIINAMSRWEISSDKPA
jgi:hypothetical protein